MADVFSKHDARDLLSNKFVLLIGDSNMRALYKDLLCLLHDGGIIPEKMLRRGSERAPQFGDEILEKAATKVGRGYFEVRESKKKDLWVRYIFVTQAIAPSLMKELDRLEDNRLPPPDIIVLNSCLWDITRWGPEQEDKYKQNLATLFHRFRRLLPPSALVVWTASLPVATERVKGGVFIQQIEFMKHSMRFMLLEANLFTHNLCRVFGFNFLDLHYYMQYQLNRRTNDGLHWEPPAVRYITNILLTHFALSFNKPLPGNVDQSFQLENHDQARQTSLEKGGGGKIHLDSKIAKYLKKFGMEVTDWADGGAPSRGKEESSGKRVRRQARRSCRDKKDNSSQSSRHSVPDKTRPPAPRHEPKEDSLPSLMVAGPSFHSIPIRARDHPGHRLMATIQERIASGQLSGGVQVDGPPYHSFTGHDPAAPGHGPQPDLGIEPLFSSMTVAWPHEGHGPPPMPMMPPERHHRYPRRSHRQQDHHQFNLAPNEFWLDYPVTNFPWNQQH